MILVTGLKADLPALQFGHLNFRLVCGGVYVGM